ncbi:MAG: translation initiation factor IF-2 [Candidatus Magasanikbacteria bacterium CG_4_9_14_0_2_um_filter_42_11]|uniref:Translation initiation factor IF-2 n=1 Tax=Candidatus Magasanikbacteria bacterium CG_4_9_14_0_2_um_filter_42_11 TaxID=1974643 RepID=A0A2M8F9E9_9BACT|nr:MAG: translation initiation factor IF-2 [Candidatus Magasanikbacteria bacterium CG10_big_fil_rev_8_21_14_0_10_43_9]PIY92618.1 MAG: translation initiation factor IF-2 [Candidatus Magasanikbacteria bacterium CG_4_10_14_0_8_um_filter_42_12]PJC52365.1 MAG: translation initiation factor IF-2 [Candidatus Magasanikbacteria bacterium CG_4_9_14_0_2_um_filter_42_11]
MNVTELARRLRTNTKELLDILPGYGFDIGQKAIKIDDRTAELVMRKWKFIKRDLDKKKQLEQEEKKQKERELRKESGETVTLPDRLMVKDFAERLNLSVTEVIKELMKNGILANQNQDIDYETAAIMAEELGFFTQKEDSHEKVHEEKHEEQAQVLEEALKAASQMERRAPVVVVMGHVDHGKTTLLDTIRKAHIASDEKGGITQHIGAYQTIWKDPKTEEERAITFIDTPGHEAFTVMRSRGAKVADLAILVVAADDGVKPQTEEVIQILKAAKIPYVVAINKMDKDGADPKRTMTELSGKGVQPEEWGGDVPMVQISAKNNLHIDKLLDTLLLVADMNEDIITADPHMPAVGTIIESHVDKGMGPVATILVQSGTLKKGENLVIGGEIYGRVRAMRKDTGEEIGTAGPSVPAQIIGFKVAPTIGDILDLTKSVGATHIDVKEKKTQQTGAERSTVLWTDTEDDDGKKRTLNLVIKADVLGSLEAIIGSLDRFKHDEVAVRIVGKGLGNIAENDVATAEGSGATVIGFNVKPTSTAEVSMREKNIAFKQYSIIYDLIDWIRDELEQLLESESIVHEIGNLKVLAVFRTDKKAMTVGGRVETGKVKKSAKVRVMRDGEELGKGVISELQAGHSPVKEVAQGTECGIRYEGKVKIEKGDILEAYEIETKERKLELDSEK